jgi:hypothetical protein
MEGYRSRPVDVVDLTPSACLLESSTDQVLCVPFYHSAGDRLPGIQTMALVEALCLSGEITHEIV